MRSNINYRESTGISDFAVSSKFDFWLQVGSNQVFSNSNIGNQKFQEFQLVLKMLDLLDLLDPENVGSFGSGWIQLVLAGCKKNTL